MKKTFRVLLCAAVAALCLSAVQPALADGPLTNVQHIIVIVQENHSFDNYLGAAAYAPGSPYHNGNGSCSSTDHLCVDGLTCTSSGGNLTCTNSNVNEAGTQVFATHATTRCITDPDHSWYGEHLDLNFESPNSNLTDTLDDGFERDDEPINGTQVMQFYNQADLPFYYDLASKFAISDRHFAGTIGPTFPNRSYLDAATSFGHLTTSDSIPSPITGYKPINGTIYDLLDSKKVSWGDYYQDFASDAFFREFDLTNNHTLSKFYSVVGGSGTMPSVLFVDPNFGTLSSTNENDEHPPTDIQRGQYFVSQAINAIRNGPYWKNSIIILTWDESGGFYDHAVPPAAMQGGARTPDGVYPGQCEDKSNPPASEQPGGGTNCASNSASKTDTSVLDAEQLCPALKSNPTGPFPTNCDAFDQLGIRVPFLVISPYAKAKYVSHTVTDHTSILRLIENRFLGSASITSRDKNANDMEDLFDFTNSPSLNTTLTQATAPVTDCTPAAAVGAFGATIRDSLAKASRDSDDDDK